MEVTLAMPEKLAQMLEAHLPELMMPVLGVLLGLLCLGVLFRGTQWLFAALEASPFNYEPPEPSLQPQEHDFSQPSAPSLHLPASEGPAGLLAPSTNNRLPARGLKHRITIMRFHNSND